MNYKGSYIEQLTNELTSIELEYVNNDRWGNNDYSEEGKELLLVRAPKYSSKENSENGNYDNFINEISQHALNEITLLQDEIVERFLKRLSQLDAHIDEAWKVYFKHWDLFSNGQFSSLQFQWDFFHFFNIPLISRAGIMENPNFNGGITSDNFFWDLHDAMMYKQGAIRWILWHLKEQLGLAPERNETNPLEAEYPSPDSSITSRAIPTLKANLHRYNFFSLRKVVEFGDNDLIISFISSSILSKKIAALSHFEFIDTIPGDARPQAATIGYILGNDKDNVRKEISSLYKNSDVDRSRYKAGDVLKEIAEFFNAKLATRQ